jgi:SAM-dependent methyltransferase
MKKGMVLDKVVLLGRTLEEYRRYFALDVEGLRGKAVLDVAGGVGSFCAEARALGLDVTAFDPIYGLPWEEIQRRCGPDLDHVIEAVRGLKTYRWDFYQTPENLRRFRERAYRTFLEDYQTGKGRYVPGQLPKLPFGDGAFDLTLISYFLLVYEDHFDYEFHRRSVLELMRVTRGEARLYPIVTFEAERCSYLPRFEKEATLRHLSFDLVRTDFEFLAGSNFYLRIRHRG